MYLKNGEENVLVMLCEANKWSPAGREKKNTNRRNFVLQNVPTFNCSSSANRNVA
jgi:hypothetical protein